MKYILTILALCVLVLSITALGQVPNKISYQGLLTTSSGTPVADGSYNLKFEIFNLPAAGTMRHSETQTGVSVQQGTFSSILGINPKFTFTFSESLYVEVTAVSGPAGPTYPLTFSPRSELTSAPYALAPWAISGDTISYTRGNVGIGTTDPGAAKLAVWGGGLTVGRDLAGTDPIGLIINPDPTFHRVAFGYYDRGFIYYGSLSPFEFFEGNTIFNQKVGIGTTSPTKILEVAGSAKISDTLFSSNISSNSPLSLQTGGTTRMFINDANGRVGIGTTSPGTKLDIKSADAIALQITADAAGATRRGVIGFKASDGTVDFKIGNDIGVNGVRAFSVFDNVAGFHRLLVDNNGNVGIGTTSPAALLHVNGSAGNNTGVWSNLSDRRLKKDIEPIHSALETVTQLQGVSFRWKDPKKDAEFGRVRGLIAQDVEKVLPEWIRTDPDGYKRIEPIGVDALLIEAIKQQQKEIEEQAQLTTKLVEQIRELKEALKSLVEQKQDREKKSLGELK